MNLYSQYVKRWLDFVVGVIAFLIASPVFIIIMVLLFLLNDGKPFFFQKRPGKNGVIFKVIKFKTMNDKRSLVGELLSDEERLTTVGKFVRKTSLDEIPQLLNVIKGDMSLIGPRPLLIQYLELYNDHQKRRHNVAPGISGWAQVNGRNAIPWKEKFDLDVWYVDHVSFWLDLKIVFMTMWKVLKSEGISGVDEATVKYFEGND